MLIHINEARVVGPHSFELVFDDCLRKRVNLRPELNGAMFEQLRDILDRITQAWAAKQQ